LSTGALKPTVRVPVWWLLMEVIVAAPGRLHEQPQGRKVPDADISGLVPAALLARTLTLYAVASRSPVTIAGEELAMVVVVVVGGVVVIL
jgi:hypothetical protein